METYMAKPGETGKKWYVIDAKGKTLGRLSVTIARILCGKHRPEFTPGVLCGDHVIVINADGVAVTGKKRQNKFLYHHSLYPGGLKAVRYGEILDKHPERALMHAVRGMLPKTIMGRKMLKRLRVYRGAEHPHAAQTPEIYQG